MKTRIGDLNKIIDIQAPTRVSDGMGGFTVSYTTKYSDIYAAIRTLKSSEQTQADQTTMTVTHKIQVRYKNVMRAGWRVKFGDRYFNIAGIDPDKKNEYLFLLCKEVKV